MKKSNNNGKSDNELEIAKKIRALKRDWRGLKTDAERFPRIDEIRKLGCSNRRLAKGIGVDDKTIGNCLNKHTKGETATTEAKPHRPANATRSHEPATIKKGPVVAETKASPESTLLTEAQMAQLRKRVGKLDPARVAAVLDKKPAISSKSHCPENNEGVGHADDSRPNGNNPIAPPQDRHMTREEFLDEVYNRHYKQMADQNRLNALGARALGPQK